MKFKSTKKFGPISTGHRQWKHKGHCSYVHGYGRYVRLSFEASELDECGWFGWAAFARNPMPKNSTINALLRMGI